MLLRQRHTYQRRYSNSITIQPKPDTERKRPKKTKGNEPMKTITQITYPSLALLALACFALSQTALAVSLAPDRGFPKQNTAEGENALSSLATGADNTAMGFDVPENNTTGSDNAQASWIWSGVGRLNPAVYQHTATLLQNGMVSWQGETTSILKSTGRSLDNGQRRRVQRLGSCAKRMQSHIQGECA
jgi:hypothetical protein